MFLRLRVFGEFTYFVFLLLTSLFVLIYGRTMYNIRLQFLGVFGKKSWVSELDIRVISISITVNAQVDSFLPLRSGLLRRKRSLAELGVKSFSTSSESSSSNFLPPPLSSLRDSNGLKLAREERVGMLTSLFSLAMIGLGSC